MNSTYNKGGQIFKNPLLEKLTKTNVFAPIGLYYSLAFLLMYLSWFVLKQNAIISIFTLILGWLFFTLVEYLIHRYLFHIPSNTKLKAKVQYAIHGVHHQQPKDKDRLAMPIPMSLLLAGIFFLLFYLVLGIHSIPFATGFYMGYGSYLVVHFLVHSRPAPNNIFKRLWLHHHWHHHKEHDRAFGVSMPLWDMVLDTMPTLPSKKR